MKETELATLVKDYWAARGFQVNVEARTITIEGSAGSKHNYIAVRSDMIGGLPRNARRSEVAVPWQKAA